MANAFDSYREALVIESQTVWPGDLADAPRSPADRAAIERRLHADPARAAELDYVRLHAGFIRRITVTAADIRRTAKS